MPLRREFLRSPDVVHVTGIAAVDEDVPFLEMRQQVGNGRIHHRRRHHQPDGPGFIEFAHEIGERIGPRHLFLDQRLHRFS